MRVVEELFLGGKKPKKEHPITRLHRDIATSIGTNSLRLYQGDIDILEYHHENVKTAIKALERLEKVDPDKLRDKELVSATLSSIFSLAHNPFNVHLARLGEVLSRIPGTESDAVITLSKAINSVYEELQEDNGRLRSPEHVKLAAKGLVKTELEAIKGGVPDEHLKDYITFLEKFSEIYQRLVPYEKINNEKDILYHNLFILFHELHALNVILARNRIPQKAHPFVYHHTVSVMNKLARAIQLIKDHAAREPDTRKKMVLEKVARVLTDRYQQIPELLRKKLKVA